VLKLSVTYTFGIVKPHAVRSGDHIQIVEMIKAAGMSVEWAQIRISAQQAQALYKQHEDKPFYAEVCQEMTGGDVLILKIGGGEQVVSEYRTLMGATNPAEAKAGTIRARFGVSIGNNAVHGSDSNESAARELEIFSESFKVQG
jgi:nucleoside-diphosphate kinase